MHFVGSCLAFGILWLSVMVLVASDTVFQLEVPYLACSFTFEGVSKAVVPCVDSQRNATGNGTRQRFAGLEHHM